MTDPVVRKGEKVTCINGHVICEVVRDIRIGDLNWSEAFGNWRHLADIPQVGSTIKPNCSVCGAPFIDQRPGVWRMHFEDGSWKPEKWAP